MSSRPLPPPPPSDSPARTTRLVLLSLHEKRRQRELTFGGPPREDEKKDLDETQEEEHPLHVDERWLVSYADMMTLLFGLFVMLYAMADKFEKVAESTSKTFQGSEVTQTPAPMPSPVNQQQELQASKAKVEELQAQLEKIKSASEQLTIVHSQEQKIVAEKIQEMQAKITRLERTPVIPEKADLTPQVDQLRQTVSRMRTESETLQRKLVEAETKAAQLLRPQPKDTAAKKENQALKEQHSSNQKAIEALKSQLLQSQRTAETAKAQLAQAQPKSDPLKAQLAAKQQAIAALESKVAKLSSDLSTMEKKAPPRTFMAVVINWASKDHDIDMLVEDPQGRSFDFKHRKYNDSPGNLALDTRRGPGTELWQTDRILPGKYKVTYIFYNQYGNTEKAPVSGTVFTPKGSFPLPLQSLDYKALNRVTFTFTVEEGGKVSILP